VDFRFGGQPTLPYPSTADACDREISLRGDAFGIFD